MSDPMGPLVLEAQARESFPKTDSALATLLTIMWLLLLICSPAVVWGVYRGVFG